MKTLTILRRESLYSYVFWNLLDKGLVFAIPLLLITVFNNSDKYIELEYIISIVTIIATFIDFGMNSYFFYFYSRSLNKSKALLEIQKVFAQYFVILFVILSSLLFVDFIFFPINDFIFYILGRSTFILLSTFLISYYRLKDTPSKGIFFTLFLSFSTLFLLTVYYIFNFQIGLELIFYPQIIACIIAFFLFARVLIRLNKITVNSKNFIYNSILYSWPSILQIFILMFISNYGKINAIDKLTPEEGVFLGFTTRLCLIIQLAHSSFIGYYAKNILTGPNPLFIDRKLVSKYLRLMILVFLIILIVLVSGLYYLEINIQNSFYLAIFLASYTLVWCINSLFEMYYSRINKNIYRLYFAILNGLIFLIIMALMPLSFLFKLSLALLISSSVILLFTIYYLKRLKFQFNKVSPV